MKLLPYTQIKGYNVYVNVKEENFVVYDGEQDPVAKEAVRLFVQNDIDINLPIISWRNDLHSVEFDIDYDKIIKRR